MKLAGRGLSAWDRGCGLGLKGVNQARVCRARMNLPCTVAVACVSFLLVFTLLGCTGSAHRDPVAGASSNALSQTPPVDAAAASASAMPPNEPLLGRVIGIDPGHNGRNWAVPGEVRKQIWNEIGRASGRERWYRYV